MSGNSLEVSAKGSLRSWYEALRPFLKSIIAVAIFVGGATTERIASKGGASRAVPANGTAYNVVGREVLKQLNAIEHSLIPLKALVEEVRVIRCEVVDLQQIVWSELGSPSRPKIRKGSP